MHALTRLGRLLFAAYGLAVFTASLLVVVPGYFILFALSDASRAPHRAHRISQRWAAFLLAAFGIRFEVQHAGRIDPRRTYVFVSNHRSMIDIPAYAAACRNTFRFLAKAELTRIPFMGYIIRRLYVSVNRSDKNDRSRSMDAMKKSLAEGVSVFICPEGTRNRTDRPLLDFKDGAFRLAIVTGTPLAVLTLKGTDRLLNPNRPAELRPGRITGVWSEPIATAGMTEADLPALKRQVHDRMMETLVNAKPRPLAAAAG